MPQIGSWEIMLQTCVDIVQLFAQLPEGRAIAQPRCHQERMIVTALPQLLRHIERQVHISRCASEEHAEIRRQHSVDRICADPSSWMVCPITLGSPPKRLCHKPYDNMAPDPL